MVASPSGAFSVEVQDLGRVFRRSRAAGLPLPWRRRRPGEVEEIVALRGVNLQIRPGELFGLLGPNGAGKTTLIKILATLLLPTQGRAWVDGIDVVADPYGVRRRINIVSGGEVSGYGIMTVRENLWMFAQLHNIPTPEAHRRIDRLLQVVGLAKDAHTKMNRLSTGMRQKMNFCRGFLNHPKVLFLDEPTLGLDVGVARSIRSFIRDWVREEPGRTLLLTTHYMAEADELCDRVAIIDQGRIVACDTPANLKRQVAHEVVLRLEVSGLTPAAVNGTGREGAGGGDGLGGLARLPGVLRAARTDRPATGTTALDLILEEEGAVARVMQHLFEGGVRVLALQKAEPTLEDVFLRLVGRRLSEDGAKPHGGPGGAQAGPGEQSAAGGEPAAAASNPGEGGVAG